MIKSKASALDLIATLPLNNAEAETYADTKKVEPLHEAMDEPPFVSSSSQNASAVDHTGKAKSDVGSLGPAVIVTMPADTTITPLPSKPKTAKQEQVLTLLSQADGTTIDEVMQATNWQQHSVRGFFAGTVRKKLGFELTSEKEGGGERRYAIKLAA